MFLPLILQHPPLGATGLVYSDKSAFLIEAPKGWKIDTVAGKKDGLPAVLYPAGSSWEKATSAMYAHTDEKESRTLTQFLKEDCQRFLDKDPKQKVSALPMMLTKDKHRAQIRRFDSVAGREFDEVAYIELGRVFAVVVLTSRTYSGRKQSLPAFESIIHSFQDQTSKYVKPRAVKV